MKRKGFTLIELLAVIVILAIIALIATPIILNIIGETKEESIYRSAEMYLSALDNSLSSSQLKDEKISDGTYDILENGNACLVYSGIECTKELNIEVKGEKPESGKIIIEKGIVVGFELVYSEKIIKKDVNGELIKIDNPYKEVIDSNPGIICGNGTKEDTAQETCYIKSIEDLVALSTLVNKGTDFSGKIVELEYSLDFNNSKSYASGDINKSLIEGEGFDPIGHDLYQKFKGTFEGNNNTIKGLYINTPDSAYRGLFGHIESAIIQNLNIEGASVTGASNSSALIGKNNLGTVQNINLNNINLLSSNATAGGIGSLVGYNSGTLKNIKVKNINVEAIYHYIGGLVGDNSGTIENIQLDNVSVKTEKAYMGGLIGRNSGTVKNIKSQNINITGVDRFGGLIGINYAENIENIQISNVVLDKISDVNVITNVGGLIGYNQGSLGNDIRLTNIILKNCGGCGGLIGYNQCDSIKNIIGKDIKIVSGKNDVGGLIGQSLLGTITQIKLTNVSAESTGTIGGLVGTIRTGMISNVKIEGNIKGTSTIGLIVGYRSHLGSELTINNVVAKGNIEGTGGNIGGLVGRVNSTSEIPDNISGVYLSGKLTFTDNANNNRTIGNKGAYSPIFKTLASSSITINGNTVSSTDISSVDGKTLENMGKVSQSEYEAIGFDFNTSNECYWYFDKNDELDLKIKAFEE